MSLRRATIRGVSFASVARISSQLISMVTLTVLAAILDPAEFGVVGLASVLTGFLALFSNFGTGAAIVQRETLTPSLLCSVFWFNALVSVLLSLVLFAAAPVAANFFETEALAGITQVLALTFLLNGLATVPNAVLQHDLRFKEIAIIEIASAGSSSIVAIAFAYQGHGAWSLVYQAITRSLFTAGMSNLYCRWCPSLQFSKEDFGSVLSFSGNLTGFNTLNYFVRNADNLLIGKFLGTEALGYYALAYRLMLFPVQNLSRVITNVLFPVLSRVQNDNKKFRDVYTNACQAIAIIAFPAMAGLFVVAVPLIDALLGEKWLPAGEILRILAPVGLIQSVSSTVGVIYQAKGKTGKLFAWGTVSSVFVVGAFIVGLPFGVQGVASSYLAVTVILLVPTLWIPFRLVELKIASFTASLSSTLVISLLMGAFVTLVGRFLGLLQLSPNVRLFFQTASGISSYIALSCVLNKKTLIILRNRMLTKPTASSADT